MLDVDKFFFDKQKLIANTDDIQILIHRSIDIASDDSINESDELDQII
jgi:hypothetical protein